MSDRLHPLLRQVGLAVPPGLTNGEVTSVSCDSRRVGPGTVFVGLPGAQVDGGVFWPQALQAGAVLAVHSTVWLAGTDREGDVVSTTVIFCTAVAMFPQRSVAFQVRVTIRVEPHVVVIWSV